MNRYHLLHVTEFQYDGYVSESYNEVRLRPIHDEMQSCISFRLTTSPASHYTAYRDSFGNWVYQVNVLAEHRHLRVETESVVLAHDIQPCASNGFSLDRLNAIRDDLMEEHYDYVAPTRYVPLVQELQELVEEAEQASNGTVSGFAAAAAQLIHARFQYVKGSTHVGSSILDSMAIGAGVCQDFAHILLGTLRARGVPARYVSGYLVPQQAAEPCASMEEVIGGQASHAWAEVLIPGSGWVALDPTLGAPAGLRHVRVAYGRDYGDVAPVRGVYKGHAGQRLSVNVLVRPGVDSEGHELLQETSASPEEPVAVSDRAQQPGQQQQ